MKGKERNEWRMKKKNERKGLVNPVLASLLVGFPCMCGSDISLYMCGTYSAREETNEEWKKKMEMEGKNEKEEGNGREE